MNNMVRDQQAGRRAVPSCPHGRGPMRRQVFELAGKPLTLALHRMSVEHKVHAVAQLFGALEQLHSLSIMHRDLKPAVSLRLLAPSVRPPLQQLRCAEHLV